MKRALEFGGGLIIIIIIGFVLVQALTVSAPSEPVAVTTSEAFVAELQADLETKLVEPVDSYDPGSLMKVLPGLRLSDFDGVEYKGGTYTYREGVLLRNDSVALTEPTDAKISKSGFTTLVANAAARVTQGEVGGGSEGALPSDVAGFIEGSSSGAVLMPDMITITDDPDCPETDVQCPEGQYPYRTKDASCSFECKPPMATDLLPPIIQDENGACPQDIKMCLDGSYVSRTGPGCTFADCEIWGEVSVDRCAASDALIECPDGSYVGPSGPDCGYVCPDDATPLPTPAPTPIDGKKIDCPMDAMQCPDGSYVGRSGPDCSFACPGDVPDSGSDPISACTEDLKQCPDGLYVPRLGPSCDFAPCLDAGFPVRYGEDVYYEDEYRRDCERRGGVFNTCGSVCAEGAEACAAVCAVVCEAPSEDAQPQ